MKTNARPSATPATSRTRLATHATLAALLAAGATMGGCQVAKESLRADFNDFNTILHRSQTEQLLLNLVRMRFREAPLFLQAGSLTASYENTVSGGAQATAQQGDASLIGVTGNYTFSSKPTIAYTPVEGQQYVQQLMGEISPQTFALLLRAGWPVRKLCDLLVERAMPVDGQSLDARPRSPSHAQFCEFVNSLAEAESAGRLTVARRTDGGYDLHAGDRKIELERFQLRSLFSAMFEAAECIEVPAAQASWTPKVTPTDEMRIRATEKPAADAIVSVLYAGWYYSIANDDLRSKDTLALFMQLSRIQSAAPSPPPQLTIPVR